MLARESHFDHLQICTCGYLRGFCLRTGTCFLGYVKPRGPRTRLGRNLDKRRHRKSGRNSPLFLPEAEAPLAAIPAARSPPALPELSQREGDGAAPTRSPRAQSPPAPARLPGQAGTRDGLPPPALSIALCLCHPSETPLGRNGRAGGQRHRGAANLRPSLSSRGVLRRVTREIQS